MSQPCSQSKRMNGAAPPRDNFHYDPLCYGTNSQEAFLYCHCDADWGTAWSVTEGFLFGYWVLLSIKQPEHNGINNVHVTPKREKPCYEWNHGCNFLSDWMDKSLISKDYVVISEVAPVSALPYSREIPVTNLWCVCLYHVLNTKWHKHTRWNTNSRLLGICFIYETWYWCLPGDCWRIKSVLGSFFALMSVNGRLWRWLYLWFSRQYTVPCLSRMVC